MDEDVECCSESVAGVENATTQNVSTNVPLNTCKKGIRDTDVKRAAEPVLRIKKEGSSPFSEHVLGFLQPSSLTAANYRTHVLHLAAWQRMYDADVHGKLNAFQLKRVLVMCDIGFRSEKST